MIEKILVAVAAIICVPPVLIFLYIVVIALPVMLYTEAECLRNGYPKYSVSIGLERYCMNLQGTVTVRVDKASQK